MLFIYLFCSLSFWKSDFTVESYKEFPVRGKRERERERVGGSGRHPPDRVSSLTWKNPPGRIPWVNPTGRGQVTCNTLDSPITICIGGREGGGGGGAKGRETGAGEGGFLRDFHVLRYDIPGDSWRFLPDSAWWFSQDSWRFPPPPPPPPLGLFLSGEASGLGGGFSASEVFELSPLLPDARQERAFPLSHIH